MRLCQFVRPYDGASQWSCVHSYRVYARAVGPTGGGLRPMPYGCRFGRPSVLFDYSEEEEQYNEYGRKPQPHTDGGA